MVHKLGELGSFKNDFCWLHVFLIITTNYILKIENIGKEAQGGGRGGGRGRETIEPKRKKKENFDPFQNGY